MLRVLCLYLKVAIFQPELREHAPHTTSVLKSCDLSAGAAGTLRVLRLYLKVAICQPELQEHAPRTTFALKSCDFQAGAAGGNRTRDRGIAKAGAQTTRQLPKAVSRARKSHGATARALRRARSPQRVHRAQDRCARRHSESDPTRTISAEGSPRPRQIRTAPQRERFDAQDLRRGFAKVKTNSHGATARALRHAGSPQRVRRDQDRVARRHSESASTRTISAEGSPRSRQIRTAPQRERFDTHDLRRGFAKVKTNSHGATARALRHARSPQRVRRAQDKFARRRSESASTRTICAEGCVS